MSLNKKHSLDSVKGIIYEKYISSLGNNIRKNVGIELEFPIINMNKLPINMNVINSLMESILSGLDDFKIIDKDEDKNIAGVINKEGDLICFDNSFNNIEFSMQKDTSIKRIANKFYKYVSYIQHFLKGNNHLLSGLGTNPYKEFITDSPVKIDIYNAIRGYLTNTKSSKFHNYSYFPPYLSSIQTHVDVSKSDLLKAINLYNRLDFARAILFSNSLAFPSEVNNFSEYICFRDYLWEKSAFSYNKLNVGKTNEYFTSHDQIVDSYLPRSIFITSRNNKYNFFSPVPLKEYFTDERYDAIAEDISTFFSFRTVELTFRGTIEIRSDCAQPISEAFAPAAFNQGLSYKLDEATTLCDSFFEDNNIKFSNSKLRDFIVSGKQIPGLIPTALSDFLSRLVNIAFEGLQTNSSGDEVYIKPLINRARTLSCPALITKSLLFNGNLIEDIIQNNSSLY